MMIWWRVHEVWWEVGRWGRDFHLLLSGEEESSDGSLVDELHSRLLEDFSESICHHRNKQVEEDDPGEGDVENH